MMGSYAVKHDLSETATRKRLFIVYFLWQEMHSTDESWKETVGQCLLVAGGKDMGVTVFIFSMVKIL